MAAQDKPGVTIRQNKGTVGQAVIGIVKQFEDATDVTVQSVHYYLTEPDSKMLNDKLKRRVDIVLRL